MEKRGHTIKILYDFPTNKCLEINYEQDKWVRVTPRTFRSFHGSKRINDEKYEGVIYYLDTNTIVPNDKLINGINILEGREKTYRKSINRRYI
jgi:hypothetical protein